ncbi:MAG: PEP-CTERM sorting domain-containing protein [Candidatus Solibacter usitatus]|nr:PEP-CTERM sorting domain-containing protein [Candidatus Solibacter usitatus]
MQPSAAPLAIFALGGQLTGIPAADQTTRFLFGGTPFADAGDGMTYLRVVTQPETSPVPEPASFLLFGTGIGATLLLRRKAFRKKLS